MSSMLSTDAPQIVEHTNKSLDFTPASCQWVPLAPRVVVTGTAAKGTGVIATYELTPTETKLISRVERPQAVRCTTFGASFLENRHLAIGDYSGGLYIIDMATNKDVYSASKAHTGMINCMDGVGGLNVGAGAPEIVTGGKDGCVRVWDPRVAEPVVSLEPAGDNVTNSVLNTPSAFNNIPRECWGVSFGNSYSDTERCIAAGYDNGDIKIFDLRTQTMRWEGNAGNGVVSVEFDRKDTPMNKLVATTLESKFLLYDVKTQHPTLGFASLTEKAHKSTIWLAKHLPQKRDVFMTTGGNGGLNLYKYHYPEGKREERDADGHLMGKIGNVELLNARIFSPQPIVGFEWNADKEGLACAVALDQTMRVFLVTKLNKY